jgi:excisionase family DNA binding protein
MTLQKRFLTLKEAAQQINRSYWRVREDAIKGKLTYVRYSDRGQIYIRQDDLEDYVERHRVRAFADA